MKLHNIAQAVVGGFLLFGASACTDEVAFVPAEAVAGEGAYFSATASTTVDILENATSVEVPIYRTNTAGAYTAALNCTVTDAEGAIITGVLTPPSSVSFADGQNEATVVVGVDYSKVVPEMVYKLTMTIEGGETTPYGLSSTTFNVSYAPWTDWTIIGSISDPGVYTLNLLWSGAYNTLVFKRTSLTNPNLEQYICDSAVSDMLDDAGYEALEKGETPVINTENVTVINLDKGQKIMVNDVECYRVTTVPPVNTGINSKYGVPYLLCDVSYWSLYVYGVAPEDLDSFLERNDMPPSYFNPQQGRFYLDMIAYDASLQPGYSYGNNIETLQLPGSYTEYFLTFTHTGNYVDLTGKEVAVINASCSDDVKSFAYKVLPGQLTDEEIASVQEELANDADVELIYAQNTNLAVECGDEGAYTIVGIGYDESGELVCKGNLIFDYKSVQKESDWTSIGWCEYTDGIIYGNWRFNDGSYLGGDVMEVEVEQSKKTPNIYRLVNPYKELGEAYGLALEGNYYMSFEILDNDAVILHESALGIIDPLDGDPLSTYSYAQLWVDRGNDPYEVAKYGWCGKLEDGVITFPSCTLFLLYEGDDNLYFTNYNDVSLAAMQNKTFDQQLLPTGYGTGIFAIDLNYVDMGRSLATKAARNSSNHRFHAKGAVTANNFSAAEGLTYKTSGVKTSVVKFSDLKETKLNNLRTFVK